MPDSPRHCEELLRRSNPDCRRGKILDCFAALAMTGSWAPGPYSIHITSAAPFKQHFKRPRDIPSRGMACVRKCALALWPRCDYSFAQRDLSDPGRNNDKT